MAIKSLIINPGSTSTKVGIFEDETMIMDETLRHSTEEIAQYDSIIAQKDFRILSLTSSRLRIRTLSLSTLSLAVAVFSSQSLLVHMQLTMQC